MSARFVVVGPPGTGKTRFLVTHIRKHLERRESAKVLFCSHTRAAAAEAMSRWDDSGEAVAISTLHSFCFKEIGATRAQTVDDAKLLPFVDQFGLGLEEGGEGRRYLEIISRAGALGREPMVEYSMHRDAPGSVGHFGSFVASYTKWKDKFGYLDFNDMLARYLKIRRGTDLTLLAVDEAQDLTPLQWLVVQHIRELNPRMGTVVVGDADQSIYEYQGAAPSGIHDWGHGADYHVLDQSYRLPGSVHRLAQAVITRVRSRVHIAYFPRAEDGLHAHFANPEWLIGNVTPDRDTLILFSDKFIRKEIEEQLMEELVPYTAVAGMPGPLDTRAGKALVAAHRWGHGLDPGDGAVQVIKAGMTDKGISAWNAIDDAGRRQLIARLAARDLSLIKAPFAHHEYLLSVDLEAPVRVRISTIHGAKGMEADDVHLILGQSRSAVEYSEVSPDAQHRLFYVGVTRARHNLYTYEWHDNSYPLPTVV